MGARCDALIGRRIEYREWHDEPGDTSWHAEEVDISVLVRQIKDDPLLRSAFDAVDRTTTEDVERNFLRLVETWRSETRNISSMTRVLAHPAYQLIIEMGRPAIPLLLRELQRKPDLWFSALREITAENPVRQEYAGYVKKMREAWLNWGKEHGYL